MTAAKTLTDLVVAQAAATPDATAVICGGEALTYAELHARAAHVALGLRAHGVGPDVPVGVFLDRTAPLAVALLAVQLAGGACLPLDPSYPETRLAFMLEDAAPPALLTRAGLAARVPAAYAGHVATLGAPADAIAGSDTGPEPPPTAAEHLAYLIYTSGSTGVPKGVMLTHRGLVNHAGAVARLYELGPGDRVAQFCSLGFDVSIEETFPTWSAGATLVPRPDDVPVLGAAWLAWLRELEISVLNLPTAYWHEWVRDLRALGAEVPDCVRLVIVGGERALGSAYRAWLDVGGRRVRWLNAYGPAEASVVATLYEPAARAPEPGDRDPPIGTPIAGTTIRILDERGAESDAGELYIGGVGLARGYLNAPDLTAEAFVDGPGGRLYRTGDRVRMLADGNLAFAGRGDDQVKIRGFRIELDEVRRALDEHERVAESAVVAREDERGDRRLVAYVVAGDDDGPPPATELRRFLAARLPRSMVPSAFVALPALPLTPNGKLDRDALPPPGDPSGALATARMRPRTQLERTIAAAWSRVLGVEEVGVDDDFFDLGGHSLQATQVVAELRDALGVPIGLQTLFEAATVERLAAAIEPLRGDGAGAEPLVPQPRDAKTRIPLTASQRQMWALESAADPPGLFNVTAQRRFDEPVDGPALRRALAYLAERHEPLRTSFHRDAGEPYQSVAAAVDVDLQTRDVGDGELHDRVAAQDGTALDLQRAPLWRACLYRLPGGRALLATTFDHLICDGPSAYVFLSEVAAAYEAFAAGRSPALRPLPVQYADFALWQARTLTPQRLDAQLEYWKGKLAGMPLGPAVPLDRVPERPTRRIVARPVVLDDAAYARLHALARALRSTTFVVTVAALQALFSALSGRTDIVLSTTLSGRSRGELEGLIGCFHGVGRIRTELGGDPTFEDVVARTRATVLGLFEHQDLPFMRIRHAAMPDMPAAGPALLAAVPIELQYFHTAHDEWAPGAGVVERPGADAGPNSLFFRGHLHPLMIELLDDGARLWGQFSYKPDFYDAATIERLASGFQRVIAAVAENRDLRVSELL